MERTNQLVLTFLLNASWQLAMITAVATLCAWLLRETSARYRHRLWVFALIISLGLPILTASQLFKADFFSGHWKRQTTAHSANAASLTRVQIGLSDTTTPVPTSLNETSPLIPIDGKTAAVLFSFYLLFLCYRCLKLLKAWLRTRAISHGAYPVEFPDQVQAIIDKCQALVGVRKVRILCSTEVTVPITIGSLNPLVIMPEHLVGEADADVLTSAIGHELVHILRRDYLLNMIYELIYLPLSFHPAAALVRRRIRQTRELGCDELVTERLLKAEVYARSLVRLAGSVIASGRSTTIISVGIADADILEERVMTMLKRPKISVRRKKLLLITAALGFSVPCLAAAPFSLPVSITTPGDAGTLEATPQHNRPQEAKQQEEREQKMERKLEMLDRMVKEFNAKGVFLPEGMAEELERNEAQGPEIEKIKKRLREIIEVHGKDPGQKELEEFDALNMQLADIIAAKEQELRAKQEGELARKATITMQQAIQIATTRQPGTVLECRLGGEGDDIYYLAHIHNGNDPANIVNTFIVISALDGRILKTGVDPRILKTGIEKR